MKALAVLIFALVFWQCAMAQTDTLPGNPSTTLTSATAPLVTVAPPAVQSAKPPQWVVDALTAIEKLPIVGPVVSKAVQWLAILGSIMTLLAAFVMGLIKVVGPLLAAGEGDKASAKVQGWMDGTVVYWLKYFSMFNAQKPDEKPKA